MLLPVLKSKYVCVDPVMVISLSIGPQLDPQTACRGARRVCCLHVALLRPSECAKRGKQHACIHCCQEGVMIQVPMERRNNRATMATFKMTTGAIACLTHTLLLHGSDFFSAMDITGDGYHIIIHDPYQNPSVQVRRPFSNKYEKVWQQLAGRQTRTKWHSGLPWKESLACTMQA